MRKALSICVAIICLCAGTFGIISMGTGWGEGRASEGLAENAIAQSANPDAPGTHGVGTWNTTFQDRYGNNINIVIYYPATANGTGTPKDLSAAPYPAIHFGHGHLFYAPYTYYRSYGDHLAAWGYVVGMGDYRTYDGTFSSDHAKIANATLDALEFMRSQGSNPGGQLEGMVDQDKTALMGHSLGGKCAILATENAVDFGMTHIKALAPMAMANDNSPSTFPRLGNIGIPTQAQCGQLDGVASPSANSQAVYDGIITPPKQFVNISGGNHYMYTDRDQWFGQAGDNTAAITREEQQRLSRRYSTAFFNYFLKDQGQYLTYLTGPEAEADLSQGKIDSNQHANFPETYGIQLAHGWNFISVPTVQGDMSVEAVLSSVDGLWTVAKYYDSASGTWRVNRAGGQANTFSEIGRTMGFWLLMAGNATLTVTGTEPASTDITLRTGWNMVGYPSDTPRLASETLPAQANTVAAFHPESPYIQDFTDLGTVTLSKGNGYWVHVTSDTVWSVAW